MGVKGQQVFDSHLPAFRVAREAGGQFPPASAPKGEYSLAELGRSLEPVLELMLAWCEHSSEQMGLA